MKSKRTAMVAIVVLALTAAAGLWFAAGGKPDATASSQQGRQKKAPLVEVAPVRNAPIARTLELTGEVVATDSVVIEATKEGPITYCPWREGDEVRAGEKLIEIDREVHRAEVQTARAALAVAESKLADLKAGARPEEVQKAEATVRKWQATLAEARKAHERQMDLITQDFTSQQSVDQAREKMEVAEAELAAAQETLRMLKAGPTTTEIAVQEAAVKEAAARLALAEAHLAECVIAAPFDGTITQVHVRPGDLAEPRSPLVEMYAPDSLVVRFSVPETYAASVRPGLRLSVRLDALPGRTLPAEVVRAYPQLDAVMRTRTVEASLEGDVEHMPHQFARLVLQLESVQDATVVPAEAVLETHDGGRVLFVVESGKAVRRKVKLGIEGERSAQVVSGVEAGEQVIVTGQEDLKDGTPVRVAGAGEEQEGRGGDGGRTSDSGQRRGPGGGQ
ncbi:MAG: efflux RND transporter periplasmic adaptor subunit [Candidatus Brocadiia bacterium]